jgi:hypothetical protein
MQLGRNIYEVMSVLWSALLVGKHICNPFELRAPTVAEIAKYQLSIDFDFD